MLAAQAATPLPPLCQMLTLIKKRGGLVAWMKEADSQTLQQSLKDLERAFKNFFEGRAEYPNFKNRNSKQSVRYPQRFKVDDSRVYLPKVGWVKAIIHRPIEGCNGESVEMKNCTVSKNPSGKYFVSIQCEIEAQDPDPAPGVVGIDLGLKHFAVFSQPVNGQTKIDPPQHLRVAEKKLKRLQRQLSRRQKRSAGWHKAKLAVARQHEKVKNQRRDFLHKLSRQVVDEYGHIKIENLNIDRDENAATNIEQYIVEQQNTVGTTGINVGGQPIGLGEARSPLASAGV